MRGDKRGGRDQECAAPPDQQDEHDGQQVRGYLLRGGHSIGRT